LNSWTGWVQQKVVAATSNVLGTDAMVEVGDVLGTDTVVEEDDINIAQRPRSP
jgi:hypothetical protein